MHLLSSEVSTLKKLQKLDIISPSGKKNNYKAGKQLFVLPMHTFTKRHKLLTQVRK